MFSFSTPASSTFFTPHSPTSPMPISLPSSPMSSSSSPSLATATSPASSSPTFPRVGSAPANCGGAGGLRGLAVKPLLTEDNEENHPPNALFSTLSVHSPVGSPRTKRFGVKIEQRLELDPFQGDATDTEDEDHDDHHDYDHNAAEYNHKKKEWIFGKTSQVFSQPRVPLALVTRPFRASSLPTQKASTSVEEESFIRSPLVSSARPPRPGQRLSRCKSSLHSQYRPSELPSPIAEEPPQGDHPSHQQSEGDGFHITRRSSSVDCLTSVEKSKLQGLSKQPSNLVLTRRNSTIDRPSSITEPVSKIRKANSMVESCTVQHQEVVPPATTLPTSDCGPGPKRISPQTCARVLQGEFAEHFHQVVVVDCRFDYEYEGGHIRGAININTKDALEAQFFLQPATKPVCVIFHCEFSKHRAPRTWSYMRKLDRDKKGLKEYPSLFYPEIYVIEGGYKGFFKQYPEHCTPQSYREMNDPAFTEACEIQMALNDKEWGESSKPRSKSMVRCREFDSP